MHPRQLLPMFIWPLVLRLVVRLLKRSRDRKRVRFPNHDLHRKQGLLRDVPDSPLDDLTRVPPLRSARKRDAPRLRQDLLRNQSGPKLAHQRIRNHLRHGPKGVRHRRQAPEPGPHNKPVRGRVRMLRIRSRGLEPSLSRTSSRSRKRSRRITGPSSVA
jgi:hypothetical protein